MTSHKSMTVARLSDSRDLQAHSKGRRFPSLHAEDVMHIHMPTRYVHGPYVMYVHM